MFLLDPLRVRGEVSAAKCRVRLDFRQALPRGFATTMFHGSVAQHHIKLNLSSLPTDASWTPVGASNGNSFVSFTYRGGPWLTRNSVRSGNPTSNNRVQYGTDRGLRCQTHEEFDQGGGGCISARESAYSQNPFISELLSASVSPHMRVFLNGLYLHFLLSCCHAAK